MKYVDLISTDTLITLWLLRKLLPICHNPRVKHDDIDALDFEKMADQYDRQRKISLLDDFLWGNAFFGCSLETTRSRFEKYRGDLPVEFFVENWNKGLQFLPCIFSIPETWIDPVAASIEVQSIRYPSVKEIFEQIRDRSTLEKTLEEGREMASLLLDTREELLLDLSQKLDRHKNEKDILDQMVEVSRIRPFTLDFRASPEVINSFVGRWMKQSLQRFNQNPTLGDGSESVFRRSRQREIVGSILQKISGDRVECWCRYQDFAEGGDGLRPIEMLMEMEMSGDLVIEEIERDNGDDIKLKVVIRNPLLHVSENGGIVVNGITINLAKQTVTYGGKTNEYESSGLPWRLFSRCLVNDQGTKEMGLASIDLFRSQPNEADNVLIPRLNREISRVNNWWKKMAGVRLLRMKDGYIYMEPSAEKII